MRAACIKEFDVAWRKAVKRDLKIPADTPAVDGHVTFHSLYAQTFSICIL